MRHQDAPGTNPKTRPHRPASLSLPACAAPPRGNDSGPIRLNRYLSQCGVASRRKADELIAAGRVAVNGLVIAEPGINIDPRTDRVSVDGRAVSAPRRLRYLLFHKPAGYLCSKGDPFGRPTIYDILPPQAHDLKYVGRLDADSEGLLLLTDDGALIERLTHPRFHLERVYLAWVRGPVTERDLRPLEQGITFQGERYQPAQVRIVREQPDGAVLLEFRIAEGKKREVRMMCRAIGRTVIRLLRTAFGPLRLGDLAPGLYRSFTRSEIGMIENEFRREPSSPG